MTRREFMLYMQKANTARVRDEYPEQYAAFEKRAEELRGFGKRKKST